MMGRFISGQPTVYGMKMAQRIRWRDHALFGLAHARWLASIAALNRPEPEFLYTDENIPVRNPRFSSAVPCVVHGTSQSKEQQP